MPSITYNSQWVAPIQKKFLLTLGDPCPHLIRGFLVPSRFTWPILYPNSQPNRHLDQFIRISTAYGSDTSTDDDTSVAIGCIYALHKCTAAAQPDPNPV